MHYPWGGKLIVDGVKFGTMKGEETQKIIFGTDHGDNGVNLLYVPPYSNWTRKFQPFEFVYNGRQVYHDDQKPDAVPFDVTRQALGDRPLRHPRTTARSTARPASNCGTNTAWPSAAGWPRPT